jgi:threonyl-tRNA synthetase
MIIRKEIEDYLRELHKDKGYLRVWTPHLAKEELYKTSGHADKF